MAAKSSRLRWCRIGQEELPLAGGQARRLRALGCDCPGAAKRSYPRPETRGSSREELPHTRGQGRQLSAGLRWCSISREELLHARNQGQWPGELPRAEVRGHGLEEVPHTRGQGQRPGGATPWSKEQWLQSAGGPRRATPCSRSGGAALRRYPSPM